MGQELRREDVTEDTPLLLKEAARLAFPDGSVTEADLKRAVIEGRLVVEKVAGKTYTTFRYLKEMAPGATTRKVAGLGTIYVVGYGPYVKIGYTGGNPDRRINHLRTGAPETLIVHGLIPGTRADEASLHSRFAEYRLQGEWFRLTGELMMWIRGGCAA